MQHITPDMVEAAYSYLLTTLPFRRWRLPHPDKIHFRVLVTRDRHGHWRAYTGSDEAGELAISIGVTKSTCQLTQTVAHEMVHMRQEALGHRDHHGRNFTRLANLVCRRHGFDRIAF